MENKNQDHFTVGGKKHLKKSIFYQSNVKHRQDFNLKGKGVAEVVHLDTRKVIGEKKVLHVTTYSQSPANRYPSKNIVCEMMIVTIL